MGVKLFRLLSWHKPVVISSDEQDRPGRDLVDDPFGVKTQCIVDILQGNGVDGPRVIPSGCCRKLGGLPVGKQYLTAFDEL
jgi:hypothetical protein